MTAPPMTPKSGARGALEANVAINAAKGTPYRRDHEASRDATWREPRNLSEYLREFRSAVLAEMPEQLHGSGKSVESERGLTIQSIGNAIAAGRPLPEAIPDSGGSHMGGPRWLHEFRAYLDVGGSALATYVDDHGEEQWAHPLRSSIRRMELSESRIDGSAARYLYLLRRCRVNYREAWAAQLGGLLVALRGEEQTGADDVLNAAESWATEALRRWWSHFVERPLGRLA